MTLSVINPSMDNGLRQRELTRRLWAGTIVITALCSHSTTLLMSSIQPAPSAAPKAQWNNEEVLALLNHLDANKSQGEGAGNFKDVTFSNAVTSIAPFHSSGPPKTVKHCKTKWASVRQLFSLLSHALTLTTKYFRLNQYIRPLRPIRMFRVPTGITPTVRIFKAPLLPLFSIPIHL